MLDAIKRNFGLKTAAVVIGVVLWFTFNYLAAGEAKYAKTLVVPVTIQHAAAGFVASTNVQRVTIELSGPRPKLDGLTPDDFSAFVDATGKGSGTFSLEISLRGAGTDTIKTVTPATANLSLDRYGFRKVPVVLQDAGVEPAGMDRPSVVPSTVTIAGAQSAVAQVVAAHANFVYPTANGAVVLELRPVAVDAQLAPVTGVTVDPPIVRAIFAVKKGRKSP